MALHLDNQRKINKARKHLSSHVGKIPIHTFYKKFEMPSVAEGFTEIKEVCFVAKFIDDKDKATFSSLT